ncbi:MAG: DUF4252 domain-containing protein [Alistipes sp.]|nr:DUF4252 domain-containing protein [Alistipes sp.]MBO7285912.1 DUF4252 domain-containing protein [Alistipes sp.]
MKRFIVMIMMLLPFSAMASIPEINELADRYSSVEDVTVVNLTGEMLAMAGASGEIDPSVIENIVIIQSEKARYVKDVSKHFDKMVADANLKSIANIDKDGTAVNIYQKSVGDVMDFIIFVADGAEVAVIDICGKFTEETFTTILDAIGNI